MAEAAPANYRGQNTVDEDSIMSEEIIEMYCEDCEKELGTIIAADGFCVKCFEYLCSTCIRYHKKHLPHHTLQDRANMPQDFCFDKCKKHPSEITKFFCKQCEEEACTLCKSENHKTCPEVSHIPTLVKSEPMVDELQNLSMCMDKTLAQLAAKKVQATSSLVKVQSNRKEVCDVIQSHKDLLKRRVCQEHYKLLSFQSTREENVIKGHELKRAKIIAELDKEKAGLIKQLQGEREKLKTDLQIKCTKLTDQIDTTAKDLRKKSDETSEADVHNIQLVLSDIDKAETEVKEMKMSLDSKKRTGQKCGLFVAMKHAKSDMTKLKLEEKKTNRDTEICHYMFQAKRDDIDLRITRNEIEFGHLLDKSAAKRSLMNEDILNIKRNKRDSRTSCITGLCKVSDCLVVACNDSKCLKLIDLKQKYEKSSIKLETAPFDVTAVEINKVAATLTDARKILFIDVTTGDKLIPANVTDIGKRCYGIDYLKPNLIVACQDPGSVEILNANGEHTKTLASFNAPQYLSVDQLSGMLYVEDKDNESTDQSKKWAIKKINNSGQVLKTIYSHSSNGVVVDNNGSVYVYQKPLLYRRKDPLHQLSKDLETVQSVDKEKHISGGGMCLHFCHRESKLYIGTTWGKIVVLQVT